MVAQIAKGLKNIDINFAHKKPMKTVKKVVEEKEV